MKEKYIVSACLVGYECKYDGSSNLNSRLESFNKLGILVPMCPEVIGGLDIPRPKSEIINGLVINENDEDVTSNYLEGANKVLDICLQNNIKHAILKENSPSCGSHKIYDGSFSHKLIDGMGVTAKLLIENGIKVYSEKDEPIYDAIVVAAGLSNRANIPYNKVLEFSLNKSCIESSIEPFLCDYRCNKVIVVVNQKDYKLIDSLINNPRVELVLGGKCREESVKNGLDKVSSKYVLIHDGARPYLAENLVDNIIEKLHPLCAIVPYIISDNEYDYKIDGKNIQTPQAYDCSKLKEYINNVDLSLYRDESSIVRKYQDIEYIDGDIKNKKITDKKDILEWRKYDENNI